MSALGYTFVENHRINTANCNQRSRRLKLLDENILTRHKRRNGIGTRAEGSRVRRWTAAGDDVVSKIRNIIGCRHG
ncbi:hypothetical protein L6452_19637 [Arctium lappa]|uniref:Uncharacterized protein n=1 Tax=Arctium lappa TaxID=4217 RepID=A0ACB9B8D0_ARCLA|nr:hypothetical protein L6452_19637 [Arctium lappa]